MTFACPLRFSFLAVLSLLRCLFILSLGLQEPHCTIPTVPEVEFAIAYTLSALISASN